jgi:small subunit ribosomal protein S20
MKDLKEMNDKKDAEKRLPEVMSMLDKLAKKNIIHENKAANLKSQLSKHVAAL